MNVVKCRAAEVKVAAIVLNTLTLHTASQVIAHVAMQVRESLSYVGARSIESCARRPSSSGSVRRTLSDFTSPQKCQTS